MSEKLMKLMAKENKELKLSREVIKKESLADYRAKRKQFP
jgi:hypothetical protein